MRDDETIDAADGSVAVIGMACRFPGAPDVAAYWRMLRHGVEAVSFFDDEEMLAQGVPAGHLSHPDYVKAASVLEDIDAIDASFFGLTPREAALMDPQQRLFLETSWTALESAAYDSRRYPGRIAVYGGVSASTYRLRNLQGESGPPRSIAAMQVSLGSSSEFLATRVSYKLNLRGPSLTIQTACSTSLVAVHMACQSLLVGQADLALAGGASICVPQAGYWWQEGGITSPDGHCRAYDAGAQGTVPGSGVGVVVLKRLSEALTDGDVIRAVIRGSAVNNDGAGKVGFTAPSVRGQAEVIAEALALAGVPADTVGYVEGHGTGTALGDPIEVRALRQVYEESGHWERGGCVLGSVKTNIGHLDAAAGVAGLIKAVLALEHGQIPGTVHFTEPNPALELADSPFRVSSEVQEWKQGTWPRRAAVSSFGIGGTNAHVVLEQAPEREASERDSRTWQLLPLSARSETALEQTAEDLLRQLDGCPGQSLADLAYTLQVGRQRFEHRRVVVGDSRQMALEALRGAESDLLTGCDSEQSRPVVFMFPGQGVQHVNMGLGLYREEPVFRSWLDRCSELLEPELGRDLRSRLYPAAGGEAEAAIELEQMWLAQPAQFAVSYALARTLMAWGLEPEAMIGYSLGEYVAACLAEVFTLEDGLRLVSRRGSLMQTLPEGAMLAVPMAADDVVQRMPFGLSLAAVNADRQCVVSGPLSAVRAFEAGLGAQGVDCRRLNINHAAHSAMQDPIVEPFVAAVSQVPLAEPRRRYLSNLSGRWAGREVAEAAYWGRQLREPVRFAEGAGVLLAHSDGVFLEVGPGTSLNSLVRHQDGWSERSAVASMRHAADARSDGQVLAQALGRLWIQGVEIDWERYAEGRDRRRVILPTYPFERQRYWIDAPPADGQVPDASAATHPAAETPPSSPAASRSDAADEDSIEQIVARIWRKHFGLDRIGRHDSFFAVGGDSLLAVALTADLRERLQLPVTVRTIFDCPTIASLADAVIELQLNRDAQLQNLLTEIETLSPDDAATALSAQRRPAVAEENDD